MVTLQTSHLCLVEVFHLAFQMHHKYNHSHYKHTRINLYICTSSSSSPSQLASFFRLKELLRFTLQCILDEVFDTYFLFHRTLHSIFHHHSLTRILHPRSFYLHIYFSISFSSSFHFTGHKYFILLSLSLFLSLHLISCIILHLNTSMSQFNLHT